MYIDISKVTRYWNPFVNDDLESSQISNERRNMEQV